MATAPTSTRSPQHRPLAEGESFSTLCSWIHQMKAIIRKDSTYSRFLIPKGADSTWKKVSEEADCRDLKDDNTSDPKVKKGEKLLHLTGMLEEIADWTPWCIQKEIIEESTSIESVWDIIRSYYQFQQNEVQFMRLLEIQWEGPGLECPEHLYRRIMAHIHDNLIKKDGKLKYHRKPLTKDEEITPTIERLAILHWLQLMDPKLPQFVIKALSWYECTLIALVHVSNKQIREWSTVMYTKEWLISKL